jgi:GH25 family lysozyme M1 (1,4-beta-N-acetylmuramidase)
VPASSRIRLRPLATKAIVLAVTAVLGSAAAASAITGIDVSRWQHNPSINWAKVKADNVSFAFIKATEAANYVNSHFASDWTKAKNNGIYRGAYHFARPSVGSAKRQAEYFVAHAGRFQAVGDLPPVLDLESSGGLGVARLRTWTRNWLETVEALTGRTPIIYTGPSFWETAMGNSRAFHAYPLWIAHYTTRAQVRVPGGWPRWTFWQRSSTGRVDGIVGAVDIDLFYGTRAQLATLAQAGPVAGDPGAPPDPGTTTPDPGTTPTEPPVTKTATQVTLNLSKDAVFQGRTVQFAGRLVDAGGQPLPSRHVDLYRQAAGSSTWRMIASPTTGQTGRYSGSFGAGGTAAFKVTYAGGRRYAASTSAVRALTVRQPIQTTATLAVEQAVRNGRPAKLSGHLSTAAGRPLADKMMYVYQRPNGSSRWALVARSSTLSPTGWYQTFVKPSRTTSYKAVFRGGLIFTRTVSNLATVRPR